MKIESRIDALEKQSDGGWKPAVIAFMNEGDDEEQAIAQALKKRGCNRKDVNIITVVFVKPRHTMPENTHVKRKDTNFKAGTM